MNGRQLLRAHKIELFTVPLCENVPMRLTHWRILGDSDPIRTVVIGRPSVAVSEVNVVE